MSDAVIYRYPDGTEQVVPVTIAGLDAVQVANASERTAPRRTVVVERALLVGLLDAWQAWMDLDADACFGTPEWRALEETVAELSEAIA